MHTHAARRTGTVRRSHPRHSRHISANPLPVSRAHTPQGPCAAPAVDTITPHTHGTDTISHAWYGDDAPRPLSTVHVAWYGDDAPRPFTTGHTPSRCFRPHAHSGMQRSDAGPAQRPVRQLNQAWSAGWAGHRRECCTVQGPQERECCTVAGKWRRPPLWYGSCYACRRFECGGGAAL